MCRGLVNYCLSIIFWLLVTNAALAKDEVKFGQAVVAIDSQQLTVDYAYTFEQRARGLMGRTHLCDSCGMLFEFEYSRVAGFWMKDTVIPLDIAYINRLGIIVNIKKLFPLNMNSVSSSQPVLYALEMNQGWFEKNNIREGDVVDIKQKLSVKALKEGAEISE